MKAAVAPNMNGCTLRQSPCATRTSVYAMKPKPIPFVIE